MVDEPLNKDFAQGELQYLEKIRKKHNSMNTN